MGRQSTPAKGERPWVTTAAKPGQSQGAGGQDRTSGRTRPTLTTLRRGPAPRAQLATARAAAIGAEGGTASVRTVRGLSLSVVTWARDTASEPTEQRAMETLDDHGTLNRL